MPWCRASSSCSAGDSDFWMPAPISPISTLWGLVSGVAIFACAVERSGSRELMDKGSGCAAAARGAWVGDVGLLLGAALFGQRRIGLFHVLGTDLLAMFFQHRLDLGAQLVELCLREFSDLHAGLLEVVERHAG